MFGLNAERAQILFLNCAKCSFCGNVWQGGYHWDGCSYKKCIQTQPTNQNCIWKREKGWTLEMWKENNKRDDVHCRKILLNNIVWIYWYWYWYWSGPLFGHCTWLTIFFKWNFLIGALGVIEWWSQRCIWSRWGWMSVNDQDQDQTAKSESRSR